MDDGQEIELHEHNFPHALILMFGAADVLIDGVWHFLRARGAERDSTPFCVDVPAGKRHRVISRAQGTRIDCIYPHRDKFDEITLVYDGNDRAYATWINGEPP